jgi:hypothetical protein
MTTSTTAATAANTLNPKYHTSYDCFDIKSIEDLKFALIKCNENLISSHSKEERHQHDLEYNRLLDLKRIIGLSNSIYVLQQTRVDYGDFEHQDQLDNDIDALLMEYNHLCNQYNIK